MRPHESIGCHMNRSGMECEDIAGVWIPGILDRYPCGFAEEQGGDQVESLLSPYRNQNLIRCRPHPTTWQDMGPDLLDEERIVVIDVIARPTSHRGRAHGLSAAFPPLGHRKQLRVELPVNEGISILLPVECLRNIALVTGVDLQPAVPVWLPIPRLCAGVLRNGCDRPRYRY